MPNRVILRKRNLNVDAIEEQAKSKGISIAKRMNSGSTIITEQRQMKMQLSGHQKEEEVDPAPDVDYDRDCKDLNAVAPYARDIFSYYKYRERFFKVGNYFTRQPNLTSETRSVLVNWLVEVQETFELNHETLYLAVKLFDFYMDRVQGIALDQLQLIASACVFVSSKFDERSPPLIEDFIYISHSAFKRDELLAMERKVLQTVGYDIGASISYRFLRRYARVSNVDMPTLTLARYVLETSLLFFDFCRLSESLVAVACFVLAVRMKKIGDWTPTLQKYSGYKKEQIESMVIALNHMIVKRESSYAHLDVIYKKYSHQIFFEVALIESLSDPIPLSQPIMPPPEHLPK